MPTKSRLRRRSIFGSKLTSTHLIHRSLRPARNTSTAVASISQAGARGHLADLQASVAKGHNSAKIRKSETDQGVLETLQILQYTRLLMPSSLSGTDSAGKSYALTRIGLSVSPIFQNGMSADVDPDAKYEFAVQFAPQAIREFDYWQTHPSWNGHQIWELTKKGGRAVRRKAGQIVWVSPGIVFS